MITETHLIFNGVQLAPSQQPLLLWGSKAEWWAEGGHSLEIRGRWALFKVHGVWPGELSLTPCSMKANGFGIKTLVNKLHCILQINNTLVHVSNCFFWEPLTKQLNNTVIRKAGSRKCWLGSTTPFRNSAGTSTELTITCIHHHYHTLLHVYLPGFRDVAGTSWHYCQRKHWCANENTPNILWHRSLHTWEHFMQDNVIHTICTAKGILHVHSTQ